MNGLPEDQRDDDEDNSRSSSASRSPSSAEERPSSPEERPDSPQVQVAVDAGHQLMPVVRPYDHQGAAGAAAPLLLRHASVSSLDESSQKYKSSVSTFSDAGLTPDCPLVRFKAQLTFSRTRPKFGKIFVVMALFHCDGHAFLHSAHAFLHSTGGTFVKRVIK